MYFLRAMMRSSFCPPDSCTIVPAPLLQSGCYMLPCVILSTAGFGPWRLRRHEIPSPSPPFPRGDEPLTHLSENLSLPMCLLRAMMRSSFCPPDFCTIVPAALLQSGCCNSLCVILSKAFSTSWTSQVQRCGAAIVNPRLRSDQHTSCSCQQSITHKPGT